MPTTLCCAYLRAYQPLDAFDTGERVAIEAALHRPQPKAVTVGHGSGPGLSLIAPEERREVFTREIGGETFACLAQTRLRTLLGILALDRQMPGGAAGLFVSPDEVDRARAELAALQVSNPTVRSYLVQSPWHVPLRWFVAFDDSERKIEVSGDHPRVRYETPVTRATARVASALDVLRSGIVHPGISGMVFELGEWLRAFDPRAVIELDYASVSRLFSGDELADDHSAADIAEAIRALSEGDGLRAALYYQRAGERWQSARGRGALN